MIAMAGVGESNLGGGGWEVSPEPRTTRLLPRLVSLSSQSQRDPRRFEAGAVCLEMAHDVTAAGFAAGASRLK